MSKERYISDVKTIGYPQEIVYNYLSSFENLSKHLNEGLLGKISQQVPQIKIVNLKSDADSCSFSIPGLGDAEIRITDRDPFKTVKIESYGGLPVGITLWVQLLEQDTEQTKIRLTLDAELSLMLKAMLGNRLHEGLNGLTELLTKLPYK